MPNYLLVTGRSVAGDLQDYGTTWYSFPTGYYVPAIGEAQEQLIARDSYTLSNLFIRVTANTLDGSTTGRSRINGANGNQSVSIPAGTTGTFTDGVNTDSLVSGDLFCTQLVAGGTSGSIGYTIQSYILSTVSNTTPILATTGEVMIYFSSTVYATIVGRLRELTTESDSYYKFRVSATLSNLRVYVWLNSIPSSSTVRTRINAGNGNQSVTIPATTSGAFEDLANSDGIVSGDDVNFQIVTGPDSFLERLSLSSIQVKTNSAGRQVGASSVGPSYGSTVYAVIEGGYVTLTESNTQAIARASFTAKNMYVNVSANNVNGSTTLRIRKNGGNGNMSVSVPASTTGQFEDTINTDDFVAADLLNWSVVTGGTSGSITIETVGFELAQPAAPPPAAPRGGSMAAKMIAEKLI